MAITSHSVLPWNLLRQAYRQFRHALFTKAIPSERPYIQVDATLDELRRIFGVRSYAPNWEFSYNYEGEDLNLAKVVFSRNSDYPDVTWWQTHIRAWELPNVKGTVLNAHWEPEPTEHAEEHLNGSGYDDEAGMNIVKDALEEVNVKYVDFTWEQGYYDVLA